MWGLISFIKRKYFWKVKINEIQERYKRRKTREWEYRVESVTWSLPTATVHVCLDSFLEGCGWRRRTSSLWGSQSRGGSFRRFLDFLKCSLPFYLCVDCCFCCCFCFVFFYFSWGGFFLNLGLYSQAPWRNFWPYRWSACATFLLLGNGRVFFALNLDVGINILPSPWHQHRVVLFLISPVFFPYISLADCA